MTEHPMALLRPQPVQYALDLEATVLHWQRNALLNPEVLESLYEVNRSYLELWSVICAPSAGERRHGWPSFVSVLGRLDSARRGTAAHCPFPLFSARFNDGALWAALASGGPARGAGAERIAGGGIPRLREAAFAQTALFFAWHLVRSNPLAARVLLGMDDGVARCVRRMPLMRLTELARTQPELVRPRWPEKRNFWQALLGLARDAGSRVAEVRQLGIQMMAAECVPVLSNPRVPDKKSGRD